MEEKVPTLKEGKHGMKLVNLNAIHLELLFALLQNVRLGKGEARQAAFELIQTLEEYATDCSVGFTYTEDEGMTIEVDSLNRITIEDLLDN